MATTTVVAKLIKAHSAFKADFAVTGTITKGNSITLRNVKLGPTDGENLGAVPQPGTLYNISGYPLEVGHDPNIVTNKAYIEKMTAFPIGSKNPSEVKKIMTKDLFHSIGQLADTFFGAASQVSNACQKAPVSLKDAIKKQKQIGSPDNQRFIPKNAAIEEGHDGVKRHNGSYSEYSADGTLSLVGGAKGFLVDPKGKAHIQGELTTERSSISRPHSLAGIPSMQNPLSDVSPRAIVNPQIDRLPDFSILNWAIKIFNGFDVVKQLFDIRVDPNTGKQYLDVDKAFEKQFKEDQKKRGLRGKLE